MAAAAATIPLWAKSVGTILGGAGAAAGGAAALRKPKTPDVPEPVAMPDPAEAERARRRRLAAEQQRSGRASTILGGAQTTRSTLGG